MATPSKKPAAKPAAKKPAPKAAPKAAPKTSVAKPAAKAAPKAAPKASGDAVTLVVVAKGEFPARKYTEGRAAAFDKALKTIESAIAKSKAPVVAVSSLDMTPRDARQTVKYGLAKGAFRVYRGSDRRFYVAATSAPVVKTLDSAPAAKAAPKPAAKAAPKPAAKATPKPAAKAVESPLELL
jgi:Meckel syndrome type 1 protein